MPEELERALKACRENSNNADRAKTVQKEISPYGAHSRSCWEYDFSFQGFAGGMDFRIGKVEMHLKYGRFVQELSILYPDFEESVSKEQENVTNEPKGNGQEIDHFLNQNKSIDDAYGWFRSEMVHEYLKNGYKDPHNECEIMVLGSAHRVLKAKEVTLFHDNSGTAAFDVENTRLEREYNYFFGDHDLAESESKEPVSVSDQGESVSENPETVIDGEFVEILPELPLLKNNDQRAAFIDAYETWPIWIETKETGERYYRYDLSEKGGADKMGDPAG